MDNMLNGKTKAQETALRSIFFVVGLYYLQLAIATVARGEIRFHVANIAINPSNEPAVFWLICAFYALVCVICIIRALKLRRNA
jgi:hypothetical protein